MAVPADAARKPQKKRVEVVDNFYSPTKLTVNLKSRINWVWTDESADVHDVKLISAPKGFKKFQTEPGIGRLHVLQDADQARRLQVHLHAARGGQHADDDHRAPLSAAAAAGGARRRPPHAPCQRR